MANAKAVSKIEETKTGMAVAVTDTMPSWMNPDSNAGSENVGANDIILPRIDVLQALSPQIKKSDPGYIQGAEQGEIFNTVSGELYGSNVMIVPIMFRREYVNWQSRASGGGFRGAFPTLQDAEIARMDEENPGEIESVETHVHFVLLLDEDTGKAEEAVLSWSRSKCKASRKLNSLVQMAGGERYGRAYKLSAIEAKGPKGEYWSFDLAPVGYVTREIFDRAANTYKSIKAGEVGVNHANENGPDSSEI